MGGHHHGPELPKIPDWRIYKVEDVPQLVTVQKTLALCGLKDPWLRNEVWKYTEVRNKSRNLGYLLMKGFKLGLVAAILTTVAEKALLPSGHGNHDDKHH